MALDNTPAHETAESAQVEAGEDATGEEAHSAEDKHKAAKLLDLVKVREQEFEKGWWKRAEKAYDIYSMDTKHQHEEDTPYNILYSNTEVLLPALYSATPKPDVRARFKGEKLKPLPEMLDRFLTVAADSSTPGGESLNGAMTDAVLSSLVPGMGYVRLRLREELPFPLVYESGHYKTLIWGKATRWSKVPWVAFKIPLSKDQMFKQFDINLEDQQAGYVPSSEADDERDNCCVYEIWDKASRKVYFVSEEWRDKLLRVSDDPLGLEGFFPTPGLLLMTAKPGKLSPVPLYNYYRNQAEELNRVTVRLNKVLSAIRVRGAYNGLLGQDLARILSSDELENELIPAGEAGLLAQSGGFDKHIWLLPIEKLITVAQELYKAREAIKQVIYEITGISDIIRGSSVASETATAQDLKNKWGTVRLRRMQTIVADYARDLFRLTVDCGSDHITPDRWKEIIQMDIPTEAEKQVAQQTVAYLQMAQAQQSPQMPQPQMPGQPPQPQAPPNPQLLAAQKTLASPSMEQLLGAIAKDLHRTFVVNIQTSSTVDLDTAQDKAEVGEFMNAMGQLLAGLQPLALMGPSGVEAMKAILVAVCQRYKFGIDLSDVIQAIQPPPPPPPEPGPPMPSPQEKAVADAEAQVKLEEIASKRRILAANEELQLAEIQAKRKKLSIDIDAAELQLAAKRHTIATKAAEPKPASRSPKQ